MGWKLLKEKFGITHYVCVANNQLHIGSGYVHNLATIDVQTGKVTENSTFKGFLLEKYPLLLKATSGAILKLLEIPDTFTQSIAVYTYDGSNIIEKQCETCGWPNVTHDGSMMYDNTFSSDKNKVVSWAKRNASLGSKSIRKRIKEVEENLRELREQLDGCESDQLRLDTEYPEINAED